MVLRHSYKVELLRLRVSMKALELDLAMHPENTRAARALEEVRQQATWFEERIKSGQDPGVIIL